eukprot:m.35584 g.35584  ORF g.35584 m.35584 type:complete len:109 (-) comp44179_c0_seq2:163-489(-)
MFAHDDVKQLCAAVEGNALARCQAIVRKCGPDIILAPRNEWLEDNALHLAATRHKEILEWLVQRRIDCNVGDKRGWTALMWAANYGNLACARALLTVGASTAIRNKVR